MEVHQFVARGSARAISRAIEAWAAGRGGVSALVVPWESDATRLSMSLSQVTGDGWAVEHANLGTISLTDLGDDRTSVVVLAADLDAPPADQGVRHRILDMLGTWARQIERQLDAVTAAERPPR
jgi:hypothetical protein